jgi:uncharacterized membrane protein
MWITVSLILFYIFTPLLLIYLCQTIKFLDRVGAVVLAYFVGLLIGNIGILPVPGHKFRELLAERTFMAKDEIMKLFHAGTVTDTDLVVNQIATIQDTIITIVIPLAIPLLLFSMDLKKWLKLAKGALLSLLLAMVSLLVSIFSGYYIFAGEITQSWKVAGMLTGVYTGGTPNLAAIGTALDVRPDIFILTHTYDLIIGAVALLFLMTVAQRIFHIFLPRFRDIHRPRSYVSMATESSYMEDYRNIMTRKEMSKLLKALVLSIIIFAVGGGLSLLVPKSAQTVTVILTITTLGLLASLFKPVNKLTSSFHLGMYLILIFSLAVSSMANLSEMFQIKFLQLFFYVFYVVFGSMLIHVGLSRLFKVDADTTIIAITALTYSPPFVPAVAGALKNKEIIISGLTIGILGYAFGTYMGIFIATILK